MFNDRSTTCERCMRSETKHHVQLVCAAGMSVCRGSTMAVDLMLHQPFRGSASALEQA